MIKFAHNIEQFERAVTDLSDKQVPFALALALNDAAGDALEAVEDEIDTAFHSPTRFTRKAFFIRRASKTRLEASVQRKSKQAGRHYLEVQTKGGVRPATALESLMKAKVPYSGNFEAITPARGARLNKFGNWSPAQRNQVLSGLGAQRDAAANTTARSAARNRRRASYFVAQPGGGLPPGIYARKGKKLTKILHLVSARPRYTARFEFERKAHAAGQRQFEAHFVRRLRAARATARP